MLMNASQYIVFKRLEGELSAYPVHDYVPELSIDHDIVHNFPYILVREHDMRPWDNDSTVGVYSEAAVHVWSRYRGNKEVNEIMDATYTAVNRQIAALQTIADEIEIHVVDCLYKGSNTNTLSDGITRQGVTRYGLTLQEKT